MTREMEYAKCMAVLCKLFRMGKVTETEYRFVKDRLKSWFIFVSLNQKNFAHSCLRSLQHL
jgi:hypothetical protein